MKELTAATGNVYARVESLEDGVPRIRPEAEVVITVSEPAYDLSNTGDVTKTRIASSLRFITNAEGLRTIAAQFVRYAEEAETIAASIVPASGAAPSNPQAQ